MNQQIVQEGTSRTTTTWDYENQPTKVVQPSGTINTATYNADNLRTELQDSTGTKRFVWDGQQYLLKTNASNTTQAVWTNEPDQFTHLITQRRGGATQYPHFDALGSTRQLTDGSENITDTYLYNAWGNVLAHVGVTIFPLQFVGMVGYFYDPDTGRFYVIHRILEPETGRWWSADPLGILADLPFSIGDVYIYSGNNPVGKMDPSGLKKCISHGILHGGSDPIVFGASVATKPCGAYLLGDIVLLGKPFSFKWNFVPTCDCECCEFNQIIKGCSRLFEIDVKTNKKTMVKEDCTKGKGTMFEIDKIGDDPKSRYGDREGENSVIDQYCPDRKDGCLYENWDVPGFSTTVKDFRDIVREGKRIHIELDFFIRSVILDICPGNNNKAVGQFPVYLFCKHTVTKVEPAPLLPTPCDKKGKK